MFVWLLEIVCLLKVVSARSCVTSGIAYYSQVRIQWGECHSFVGTEREEAQQQEVEEGTGFSELQTHSIQTEGKQQQHRQRQARTEHAHAARAAGAASNDQAHSGSCPTPCRIQSAPGRCPGQPAPPAAPPYSSSPCPAFCTRTWRGAMPAKAGSLMRNTRSSTSSTAKNSELEHRTKLSQRRCA